MKYIQIFDLASHPNFQTVSLNRPDVKNAFHPDMIAELTAYFESLKQNSNLKAVILRGEGTAFCAGADLNWMKSMVDYSFEENMLDSKKLWQMFDAVQSCPVPVIAVAHGAVFGGALGILACCDYVYAEEKTKFCFSEVKLGLSPAVISDFITRKIQDAYVRPLMLSAEVFSTSTALRIGLAHKNFSGQINLDDVAGTFAANGVEAMRETKKLLNALTATGVFSERQHLTAKTISERRMSVEGQERLKKFLTKK